MPKGASSHLKVTTVTLPKGSYGGYWAGPTYHRGIPVPLTPFSGRSKLRMQGETDAFVLLRGEGEVTHHYTSDYEEFDLNPLNTGGKVTMEGAAVGADTMYAVAPLNASAAVNLNIIEEA